MTVRMIQGDVRARLKELEDNSVQCVITSPPYFGLRDYDTGTWEGGDPKCDHVVSTIRTGAGMAKLGERFHGGGHKAGEIKPIKAKGICPKCGAVRTDDQIGMESTPADYVAALVEVFREVRRVLRPDGTLWLNLGDSYANDGKWGGTTGGKHEPALHAKGVRRHRTTTGLKSKDLIGIPWRVAFALQEDGWWLRQDIIWSKPNPMPESVRDRCTKSHEYLFLFSKSGDKTLLWRAKDTREWVYKRPNLKETVPAPTKENPERVVPRWMSFDYYFDGDAIAENAIYADVKGMDATGFKDAMTFNGKHAAAKEDGKAMFGDRQARVMVGANGPDRPSKGVPNGAGRNRGKTPRHTPYTTSCDQSGLDDVGRGGQRNKRSVWTVATQPYPEAHFATFPPKLIEPCILAGAPKGGLVLDPFGGAGTTALVSDRLQRDALTIDLNPDYVVMSQERVKRDAGLFSDVA